MTFLKRIWHKILALPKLYSLGGAVVIIAVAAVGVNFVARSAPLADTASETSHVHLASVASLSSSVGPLPVTGKVTSLSQATILAQTSGEIVSLSRAIGDRVAAGSIIASFENSSQQAAVQQAQGAYDAAGAALAKATGTTAANSGITSSQASQNAENAETAAGSALQSAYAALDDAVRTRADLLFTNPRTSSPDLVLTVPDSQLVATLKTQRVNLETTLSSVQAVVNSSNPDIDSASATMIAGARQVQTFLDNLIKAVNETPPSQNASPAALSGYQSSLAAARTEVSGAISSVTSAKSAYDSATSGAASAANSADSGTTNDIKAAQANVTQALGALNAAKANLEKTLVRSPISGTIVSLPVTQGDFVSSFSQVAAVSNPGALYIDVQVTSADAKTLAIGNKAVIEGSVPGVITFVAPAIDPSTNKIEVKVGLTGDQSALTDGEVVSVALDRITAAATPSQKGNGQITIPIIAAKITPSGPIVFSVTASSTLTANPITLGSILGDQVVVTTGLTLEMDIVTDARGLAEGEAVVVDAD